MTPEEDHPSHHCDWRSVACDSIHSIGFLNVGISGLNQFSASFGSVDLRPYA
jgi:hypothetical protein